MLVRDGEQARQPLRIFAVCDLGVEHFQYMPLSRLQVELEAVPQCVQVAALWCEPIAELLFPPELFPQGDHCRTDAKREVDRCNRIIVPPQPGQTRLAVRGLTTATPSIATTPKRRIESSQDSRTLPS